MVPITGSTACCAPFKHRHGPHNPSCSPCRLSNTKAWPFSYSGIKHNFIKPTIIARFSIFKSSRASLFIRPKEPFSLKQESQSRVTHIPNNQIYHASSPFHNNLNCKHNTLSTIIIDPFYLDALDIAQEIGIPWPLLPIFHYKLHGSLL
jgi:hypothetical protein